MERTVSASRRTFLKTSAAGAAGVALGGVAGPARAAGAWSDRMPINPAIDNTRVVCCHDPEMITGWPSRWNMPGQNAPVVVERVENNLDAMAMSLAQKGTAAEAWSTIFRKPSSKTWDQVKVAVKINALGDNHPRLAVIDKVCRELNRLGVPFGNMTIYDAGRSATSLYDTFVGNYLPEGVTVSDGGGQCDVPAESGALSCTNVIAEESGGQVRYVVDIIVNIAVNKGHGQSQNGRVTLSMKNHLGTININRCPNMDMLYRMNTADAIVGGDPPRQQLCIVDSLWAAVNGPGGVPDKDTRRLIMGVFGPVVDYLIVKKIREPIMGASHVDSTIDRYLTDFGYGPGDVGDLVSVDPVAAVPRAGLRDTAERTVALSPGPGTGRTGTVRMTLPSTGGPLPLTLFDLHGRTVRRLSVPAAARKVSWDGRDDRGRPVASGRYVARVGTLNGGVPYSLTIR